MLQEQPHSHFVCRAHHAGHGSARARRVHRKAQAGGLFIVGRFEAEVFELPEIEPVEHRLSALRISQRELNRQPHVRYAELGDDSSVHELYHRVYDALRVDYHLNVVRRHAEEVHRLDEFKPLVHHRRTVDGYLRTHAPVWMLHGLFGRDVLQLLAGSAAEGAAGAGEQDFFELALPAPHEALEDGGVLGVDRHYLRARLRRAAHDYAARADKRLLVCKRYALFLVDGGKRRLQPDRARHRRHNAVG